MRTLVQKAPLTVVFWEGVVYFVLIVWLLWCKINMQNFVEAKYHVVAKAILKEATMTRMTKNNLQCL